jgi:hypothetical protein
VGLPENILKQHGKFQTNGPLALHISYEPHPSLAAVKLVIVERSGAMPRQLWQFKPQLPSI